MDPNQTLKDLFDTCTDADWDTAYDASTNLRCWLEKGGWRPSNAMAILIDALILASRAHRPVLAERINALIQMVVGEPVR